MSTRTKVSKPKGLIDLETHDCRWPIGEPRQPGFHFCGERQAPGRPYCEHHWEMAFQPAKPRQPASRPQPHFALPARAAKAA